MLSFSPEDFFLFPLSLLFFLIRRNNDARNKKIGAHLHQLGLDLCAPRFGDRTARSETTARRRLDGSGNVPGQRQAFASNVWIWNRYGRQKCSRVRMKRVVKYLPT